MSADKSYLQNTWDENKRTLLDPDKGLYELQHAKQAVSAARDAAASVDEGTGELLKAIEYISSQNYGAHYTAIDIINDMRQVARTALTAHKARLAGKVTK